MSEITLRSWIKRLRQKLFDLIIPPAHRQPIKQLGFAESVYAGLIAAIAIKLSELFTELTKSYLVATRAQNLLVELIWLSLFLSFFGLIYSRRLSEKG